MSTQDMASVLLQDPCLADPSTLPMLSECSACGHAAAGCCCGIAARPRLLGTSYRWVSSCQLSIRVSADPVAWVGSRVQRTLGSQLQEAPACCVRPYTQQAASSQRCPTQPACPAEAAVAFWRGKGMSRQGLVKLITARPKVRLSTLQ